METIEYRTIDKSKWPRGPWDDEPDKRQWQDPATGLPCLIVRNARFGNLCGYVGVDESHPFFAQEYGEVDMGIEVHGGLTYDGFCNPGEESEAICHVPGPGEPDHVWWLGFDCAHGFDLSPAMAARMKAIGLPDEQEDQPEFPGFPKQKYRDIAYVTAECTELARQLHEKMIELRGAEKEAADVRAE